MNKKFLLLVITLFISIGASFAQVYQIDQYNGQTVTTCKAVFESSGGDPTFCNGYSTNEDYTVTFCSGTPGRPIRVSFLTWDIEDNFDFLYVYDGTSTAAPLIGTITGTGDNNTTPEYFTSTGTCLTFRFVSDNSVNYCGWEAIIGCSPQPCGTNDPAADVCPQAPRICNLNGYCGNTSGWYTPDHANIGSTGSGLFCGSIENNSWISFVASSTTASFSLTSSNCIYSTSGIQAMMLNSTNCNTFASRSNCVSQSTGSGTFTITSNVPLTIGNTYYIMIDGYAGNICDYTITAQSGVQVISITSNATNSAICAGSTAVITAHGAPAGTTFSWTPTGTIIGSSTDSSITVNPTATTTYTLVATLPNGCGTQTLTYTLTVNQKKTTNTSQSICQGQSVTVGTHTYTTAGTYHDTLRTSAGCDSIVNLTLTVNPSKTSNISRSICQGQSVTVGNHTYTTTGTYHDTLRTSAGCDSIINLTLTVNPSKTTNTSQTICQGSSVTVGTHTYTTTGTYHDTLRSSAGCDSIVNLTLTVNPKKTTNLSQTICQGQSVTVGNHVYTQTGSYHDTLHTSLNCDSIVNLTLTVNPRKTNNITRSICEGQSVTVGNHVYTQTGNYSDTLQSSVGCDSIVNLALTVNPKKTSNISRTICQGQSVTVGNHTYTQTGTYHDTLQTSKGCDSLVNLTLTVNPKKTTNISQSICQGQSVTIGNHTYTQSGTYHDTLQTSLSCDSIVNLTLSVVNRITNNISRQICQGQSVTVGTHTYTQSGNYSDTLRSAAGCDSIVNLALTVIPRKSVAISRTICQGQSVTVGTHTHTQTGNYSDTLLSSVGCDSIVNLALTVNPKKSSSISSTICEGQSVTVGNHVHTQTGVYNDTLMSSVGCDSVVTLTLTVNPKKTTNTSQTICQGQSVTIGNHTYTQSGTYHDTLQTSKSCDSIVNLTLTVNPTKSSTITQSICTGNSLTVGGQTFNSTGTFTVVIPSAQLCDSTITLHLTVTDSIVFDMSQTICAGSTVTVGNQTFNQTGDYSIFLQSIGGCDSTVNLHLTVVDSIVNNISQTICEGNSVTVGGQTFNTTGIHTVIVQSSLGCDSIIHLNLTVNPVANTDLNQSICDGQSITIGNQTFNQTGNYTITLQTSLGCDSTVHLNLTVNPVKSTDVAQTICNGDSITIGNQTFHQAGTFDVTLQTSLGCDSVVHLTLSVNPTPVVDLPATICEGQTFTVGTQTFTQLGNYTIVLQSSQGCDSTVLLALSVNPVKRSSFDQTICEGESVTIGNQTFTQTGDYDVTLQSSQGCDSIVHLSLVVNPAPVIDAVADKAAAKDGEQIQLNVTTNGQYTYNWTPASQVSDPSAQNPTATISAPTWFVVVASGGNQCRSTDSVFVDLILPACNNDNVFIPNAFSPNGDGINDVLRVRSLILKSMRLIITDRWGITVFDSSDVNAGWDGQYKGAPADAGTYGYYFSGECLQGEKITQKGSITLLR